MQKTVAALILLGLAWWLPGKTDCFTVLAGKDATDSGCVLLAHNEDDRGDSLFVNLYNFSRHTKARGRVYRLRNGGTMPVPPIAFGFLWIEIPETAYADTYINSNGVALVSNSCPSRVNDADFTDGGIGFMLRRILAEQAVNARQTVQLAGRLVERYGYSDSGRTLCIADGKEAWVVHLIRGRRWIAQRVPDDQVAVIPNAYTITRIDLKDKQNFLGSPDLIAHARKQGWYSPQSGEPFDFSAAYSRIPLKRSRANYLRQRRAIQLLAGEWKSGGNEYPFAFSPKRKIRIQDLFALLRDHYEDTPWDLTDGYRRGSPNSTKNRTICTESTQYALVAELGRSLPFADTIPPILRNRIWLCLRRPDSNAFAPWYPGIAYPETHYFRPATEALTGHFSPRDKPRDSDFSFAFRVYAHLSELVDKQYRTRIRRVRREWKNFEDYVSKNLRKKEKEFTYIHHIDPVLAKRMIANYLIRLEYLRWFQSLELIRGFQD